MADRALIERLNQGAESWNSWRQQSPPLGRLDFRGANLSRAILRGVNLEDAILEDAILSGANLQRANLQGAFLRGA